MEKVELKRGREILILGYPNTDALGFSLKATRGVITQLENPRFENMIMTDAEANPGNSGGPVSDRHGTLVGVLTAITVQRLGDYSLAIPKQTVLSFLEQERAAPPTLDEVRDEAVDWSEIDERISPSVFLIEAGHQSTPLQFRDLLPERIRPVRSEFEDDACSWCSGRGFVTCPAPACYRGGNSVLEIYTGTLDLGVARTEVVVNARNRLVKCDFCDGAGYVRCPVCRGSGVDPDLR
jgi:hypothetical protein